MSTEAQNWWLSSWMVALLLAAPLAEACLVCKSDPMERVLVTELQRSSDVVLARPSTSRGRYRIARVLETAGDARVGSEVEADLPMFSEDGGKMGPGTVLLTRRGADVRWIIRAPASGLHQVLFFQKVLAIPPAPEKPDPAYDARRTAFFLNYLHHADPLLDRAAAAEIASAPYPALKSVKAKLSAEEIRAKIGDPAARDQRALYYTLLGVCGSDTDLALINRKVETLWKSNGSRNLAALLTAKLELEGAVAVGEIESRYFRDRRRTLPEIEAAVLALRVHGDAGGAVSRDRVIAAFRGFLEVRAPLVSYVTADLARWEDWESKDRLVTIAAEHGDDLPGIRRAVSEYLQRRSEQHSGLEPRGNAKNGGR